MSMNSFHARAGRLAPKPDQADKALTRRPGTQRADALLVARGDAPSRTRARQLIDAGRVHADGMRVTKAGQLLAEAAELSVADDDQGRFVSRGALKLAAGLAASGIMPEGRRCLDIGQSTGGFTDCLLQRGAMQVVGVEVGHDQLHPRLASDPRCVTLEGINARALDATQLGEHWPHGGFDLIVCDASFISLRLLLPRWPALLAPHGDILALVKPQFELGPGAVGKGGVVRDPAQYAAVKADLYAAAAQAGLNVCGWFDSPLLGGGVGNIEGNREFLIWMQHGDH